MMKNVLILFLTFISSFTFCQVKGEAIENDYFSLNSQYLYNSFAPGEIHFKDGSSTAGELNYNVVVGEFHYIEDGILKTFSDYDLKRISKIIIDKRQFIIKSYVIYEIVYADIMVLLNRRTAIQKDVNQNEGAYGTSTSSSTNKKITILSLAIGHELEKGALVNIKDELNDLEIKIEESYKILYNNQIYNVNRKSFYELYPDNKDSIKEFIKSEKIKFETSDEIIKLIIFCKNFK